MDNDFINTFPGRVLAGRNLGTVPHTDKYDIVRILTTRMKNDVYKHEKTYPLSVAVSYDNYEQNNNPSKKRL